jgi:outer membrane protein assembly factor BamB
VAGGRRARLGGHSRTAVVIGLLLLLGGCQTWLGASEAPPLPGERIPVLSLERELNPDPRIADLAVRLPRPYANADWPQAGGTPNHAMHHLAAPGPLTERWRVDIGSASNGEARILSGPVVADGRIYAIDVNVMVTALDAKTGARVWRTDLMPSVDNEGILAGGLGFARGRLYVTTGFGAVIALDAATGKEVWRTALGVPMRAPPTILGGRVFVISIDNEVRALSAENGRVLWSHAGLAEIAGLLGGAAAAAEGDIVVAPFSSGELIALRAENGRVLWSDTLTAVRRTNPVSALAHIRGRPVIDRGQVFAVSHSGRMVAIDLRTGNRLWEQSIGGANGPWVAGDFIYVLSDNAELVALSRRDGRIRWVRALQRFEDEEDRTGPIIWTGPVLAGDRLIVVGSNREVWSISPYTGKMLGRVRLSDPILIPPVVAMETVFFLTDDAELIALR